MSSPQASQFVTWSAPAGAVRIAQDVIDRMVPEITRGLGATRRRGTEVGGILLGRREGGDLVIDDYATVPCEYAYGPSYLLSPNDKPRFAEALERLRKSEDSGIPVGYFRSHTREEMRLDGADIKLFEEYFGSNGVVLLIKPFATRPAVASFFVPENGALNPALPAQEFPFLSSRKKPAPEAAPAAVPAESPADPPPVAEAPGPVDPPPMIERLPRPQFPERRLSEDDRLLSGILGPRGVFDAPPDLVQVPDRELFAEYQRRRPPKWVRWLAWTAFTLAVIAFGGALGYKYATTLRQPDAQAAVPAADPYALNLAASRAQGGISVTWNRDAAAIKSAVRGVLVVTEGTASREVRLGYSELRNGTVIYQNVAPEVKFRLELFFKEDRSLVESVSWQMPAAERAEMQQQQRLSRPRAVPRRTADDDASPQTPNQER